MYSAWSASFVSGLVAAAAIAIGSVVQLSSSSTPDPLPAAFIVAGAVIAALVGGLLVAFMVRLGLFLAGSRQLALRVALTIAAVTVAVVGVLVTAPIETHAVVLDVPSNQSAPIAVPFTLWLVIVAALTVPILVAYVAGRVARGRADAA